jgi:hypothetical protein
MAVFVIIFSLVDFYALKTVILRASSNGLDFMPFTHQILYNPMQINFRTCPLVR